MFHRLHPHFVKRFTEQVLKNFHRWAFADDFFKKFDFSSPADFEL
ncbi:hypothetical protein BSM4216_0756 [Bacillus smithii]|nr:hypothetical protein BSM4216_0756 [Bacillus smithii]